MKQKGNTKILIIILIVLAVILGIYWWNKKSTISVQNAAPTVVESDIQNPNDLMSASDNLDKTDIDNSIDSELSLNDADAASF